MYLNQSQISSMINISNSSIQNPQEQLISKILELEARLYQTNIDNQELRLKNKTLQIEYNQKKTLLIKTQRPPKASLKKKSHNYSQSTISNSHSSSTKPKSIIPSAFASVQPGTIEPITGLESNFQILKEVQNEGSQIQNSMRGLSSSRTTGIKKNILSPRREEGNIGFKSIEEIWNGNRNSETFLKKKGPQKFGHAKKKSYLT